MKIKKILSILLVLTMCTGMMPVMVFSEENENTHAGSETSTAIEGVTEDASQEIDSDPDIAPVTETGSVSAEFFSSDISLNSLRLDEPFNLEEAYDYYLKQSVEEAELYLASLSDDNRFMLLDYIDAMNEIAALKAEAADEFAQSEVEATQELQEAGEIAKPEPEQEETQEQSAINAEVETDQQEEIAAIETEDQAVPEESLEGQSKTADTAVDTENTENENTPVESSETAEYDSNENTTYPVTGTCGADADGANVTWSLDESGVLTLSGTGAMAVYTYTVVSSTYMTTAPWADYSGTITSITINSGITNIGNYAFYRLSALSSITIPEGVTTIGKYAFYKCTSLTTIGLPSTLTSIGNNALTEVTQINFAGTKENWSNINYTTTASVICSDGNTNNIAEGKYDAVTWELNAKGELSISGNSFPSSPQISEIPWLEYSEEILSVEIGVNEFRYAFYNCTNLVKVTFSKEITLIGDYAFYNCTSLREITIPSSVIQIDNFAFYNCTSLTTIEIPEGTQYLGYTTFQKCTNLAEISLPSTLKSIGGGCFQECKSLKKISIPEGITVIPYATFYQCESLEEVILPQDLTEIGGLDNGNFGAFGYCLSLKSIVIPETVTEIRGGAFFHCSALSSVTLSDNLKVIRTYCFAYCESLKEINLPDSVITISDYAFQNCTSLETIGIPESVTSIGVSVFYACKNLVSIQVPPNITRIEKITFGLCTSLEKIILPDGLTYIDAQAFYMCKSLTFLTVPENVNTIGQEAFSYCSNLKYIKFSSSAPSIGENCFYEVTATAYYPGSDASWTTDSMQSYGGSITWKPCGDVALRIDGINAGDTVYADGITYTVSSSGAIEVPLTVNSIMTFTNYGTSSTDAHVQYPTSLKVYVISLDDDGNQVGTYVSALDNVLTYSGASIKTVDNQGLRIIYSIPDATKTALIAGTLDGLFGYTLAEFGTVATWADTSTNPYLGCTGAMTSYSYRASESYDDTDLDTELNYSDTSFYYTNAFVFNNFERTKPDLAVRPYMILNTPDGDTMTIYGGVVIRNIGYVAVQCLDDFTVGTVQYNYVKKIVDYVYPDGYTEWSSAKY